MAKKKKGTPAWVNRLLSFRHLLSEDEYRDVWRRVNRLRRDRTRWNDEGQRIIQELSGEKVKPSREPVPRVRATIFRSRRVAEKSAKATGGRVVRRDSKGRFSKSARRFQVVKNKKKGKS